MQNTVKYFDVLQYIRGIAAIMVVLFHMNEYIKMIVGREVFPFGSFGDFFSLGAWIFFLISGFLMSHLISNGYPNFLVRRLLRIFPIYLIVVIVAIFLKTLIFGSITNEKLYLAITLLPVGDITYPLSIEWTLIYEVFFYIVCSFFVIKNLKRIFPYFLVLWAVFIIVAQEIFHLPSPLKGTYVSIFFSSYNLLFIIGALTYYLFKRSSQLNLRKWYSLLTVAGLIIVIYLVYSLPVQFYGKVLLVGGMMSIILLTTLLSQTTNTSYLTKIGFKIGDYSYGIYLSHVVILSILLSAGKNLMNIQIGIIYSVFVFFVTIIGGACVGKLDISLHRFLKTTAIYNINMRSGSHTVRREL